jgi:hypothetical protein
MLKSIEGVFRDGKVELLEPPPTSGDAKVIVTFLPAPVVVDLAERGISPEQAAELRRRLSTFAEDWDNFAENLEEVALPAAIREGRSTEIVPRDDIARVLKGSP